MMGFIVANKVMTLGALVHAMAIAVLSALIRAMTISLRIAMTIAVPMAVRNAVLIASNFSMPYAMFQAESVQVSARRYERSLFFFLYLLSGATARPKTLGGGLFGSSV